MKLYLLKKNPGRGMSELLFNGAAEKWKLDLQYENAACPEPYLQKLLSRFLRDPGIRGFNVTIPYKTILFPRTRPDAHARATGAVNCVRINPKKGELLGFNTDWLGITRPLHAAGVPVERAIVAGAGGAARAAIYGLRQMGAKKIWVFNRTLSKAKPLLPLFPGLEIHPLQELDAFLQKEPVDLLVQATAMGMNPHPLRCIPVSLEGLGHVQTVFDVVYKPRDTLFLQLAQKAGCTRIFGIEMLLEQHKQNACIWDLPGLHKILQFLDQYKKPGIDQGGSLRFAPHPEGIEGPTGTPSNPGQRWNPCKRPR